jgi:hypothetical protein
MTASDQRSETRDKYNGQENYNTKYTKNETRQEERTTQHATTKYTTTQEHGQMPRQHRAHQTKQSIDKDKTRQRRRQRHGRQAAGRKANKFGCRHLTLFAIGYYILALFVVSHLPPAKNIIEGREREGRERRRRRERKKTACVLTVTVVCL